MRRQTQRGLLFIPSAGMILALVQGSSSASGTWSQPADMEGPLSECVAAAETQRPEAWFCVGGYLTTTTADQETGELLVETHVINGGFVDSSGDFTTQDDYDSWCESGTVCGRKISNYTAEVKGNAAYGDITGVIGSFDIVVRQHFDGPWPQWRLLLDWDSGPTVDTSWYRANCKRHVAGSPDPTCGGRDMYLSNINSTYRRAWYPSSTGYAKNSSSLSGSSYKYHDDIFGEFTVPGDYPYWRTGTLHTGRWTKCGSCVYYQIPWTSTP